MADRNKILIADDESDIRKILRLLLQKKGYEVCEATNGAEAIERAREGDVDLIVMDIMMPRVSGIEATVAIREFSTVPILFLTARSLESDKESAYLGGGDDYLVKPFSSTELLLKITSLLRRYTIYRGKEKDKNIVSLPCDVEVDVDAKIIRRAGEEVSLRDKENEIFFYLLSKRGETVETDRIYEDVWGERAMPSSANNVMVNMLNIRKKLEDNPSNPKLIKTVWGKGYRFE
ncbi:MAG: response regulator transcription factor [Clostridia bacterium]|nr:response regulator transcription factor [Clostridia bacterium]